MQPKASNSLGFIRHTNAWYIKQNLTHLFIIATVEASRSPDLNGGSAALSQVGLPSLKPVLTGCQCRVCCLYNSTTHNNYVTTPIVDDLENNFTLKLLKLQQCQPNRTGLEQSSTQLLFCWCNKFD